MIRRVLTTIVLLALLVPATANSGPADAASKPAESPGLISIEPVDGELAGNLITSPATDSAEVEPGDVARFTMRIINLTDRAFVAQITASDVVRTDSLEEAFETRFGVREDAAGWVVLPTQTRISIKPGTQAVVPITAIVPEKVKPGTRGFAISATQVPGSPGAVDGVPLARLTSVYLLEIRGDAQTGGTLKSTSKGDRFGFGATTLQIEQTFRNTGDRVLRPKGQVQSNLLIGSPRKLASIPQRSVWPRSTRRLDSVDARLATSLLPRRLTAVVDTKAGTHRDAIGWTWRFSWIHLLIWIGLISFIVVAVVRLARRWLAERRLVAELMAEELDQDSLYDATDGAD